MASIVAAVIITSGLTSGMSAAARQSSIAAERAMVDERANVAVLRGERAVGPVPDIDGRIDDDAWTRNDSGTFFVQRRPESGLPSAQRTWVEVLYDESALYVAMTMYDTAPDSIAAQLSTRDRRGEHSDWAHVFLDSYDDSRTAVRFSVNPRGVKLDALHFGDTQEDSSWDAVWHVATRVDALGWSAEFKIPLSQLRFSSDAAVREQSWGINFGREIARYGEESFWAPVPADASGFVSLFGRLTGLMGLSAPKRVELQPYTVSSLTRSPVEEGDPFHPSTRVTSNMGLDVRYGVTSDFTLNLTVNPDFGQVEADPSVVNLSAFETFFPEKRSFFVEGTDLFRITFPTWPNLFYSRRIGRGPQGRIPSEAVFSDAPAGTTILTAAKLTGKTASGTSVGVVTAVTSAEHGNYVTDDGRRGTVPVEPTSLYTTARLIQDFRDGRSAIGAIVTSTNRRLPGGDDLSHLHANAYVAGVDGRHRFADGQYEVSGSVVASHVRGRRDALVLTQRGAGRYFQRPDAEHLDFDANRTTLSGTQAGLRLARTGGGQWSWEVNGVLTTPGFEVDDLGFQGGGGDRVSAFGRMSYDQFRVGGPFRRWRVNLVYASGWTTGGERRYTWTQLYGDAELKNRWNLNFGLDRTFPALSVDALRGGPALRIPGYVSGWFGWQSDPRRAVGIGGWAFLMFEDQSDGRRINVEPRLTYRASARLDFSVQPGMTWYTNATQYIATVPSELGPSYLFGRLEQTTMALTTRLNFTFSPTLSVQLYAQPFMSAGRYDRFQEVVHPRAARLEHQFALVDGFDGPDFNVAQFRSNVVLRYEYRPGSTVFVVWGQDKSAFDPDGRLNLTRDLGRLFSTPGRNTVLVKINYWIGR